MSYTFTPVTPAPHLRSVVKRFFVLEYDKSDTYSDYLLPDGLPSIFYIQTKEPVTFYFGDRGDHVQSGFYAGYSNTIVRFTHQRFSIVGASVIPVYFRALSGRTLHESLNRFLPLEEMQIQHTIHRFPKMAAPNMLDTIQQHITKRTEHDTDPRFLELYHHLINPGGYLQRVEDLATRFGYSTRNLYAQFRECFGMSPKKFMMLLRFNYALKYLYDHKENWNYSSIALEAGYHDQSHLIRDFKAISGKTPAEISANVTSLASNFRLF